MTAVLIDRRERHPDHDGDPHHRPSRPSPEPRGGIVTERRVHRGGGRRRAGRPPGAAASAAASSQGSDRRERTDHRAGRRRRRRGVGGRLVHVPADLEGRAGLPGRPRHPAAGSGDGPRGLPDRTRRRAGAAVLEAGGGTTSPTSTPSAPGSAGGGRCDRDRPVVVVLGASADAPPPGIEAADDVAELRYAPDAGSLDAALAGRAGVVLLAWRTGGARDRVAGRRRSAMDPDGLGGGRRAPVPRPRRRATSR